MGGAGQGCAGGPAERFRRGLANGVAQDLGFRTGGGGPFLGERASLHLDLKDPTCDPPAA